jgi:protein-S-isoprenylcysteine O-methyltransferase Ste14
MHIYNSLISIFWLIFVAYWLVSALSAKKITKRVNSWARYWTIIIIIFVLILSRIYFSQILIIPPTKIVLIIGTTLCGLGIAFAIWARWHLGKNWSNQPSIQEDHKLVTSGPYRFVRHPIYTGILFAFIGSTLVNDTVAWLVMLVFIVSTFIWRIDKEEKFMMELFSDQYSKYKKYTKKLIPFFW